MMSPDAKKAFKLSSAIEPLLKGAGAGVQGAVLAMLLAKWLVGHRSDDADVLRDKLINAHIASVKRMVADLEGYHVD